MWKANGREFDSYDAAAAAIQDDGDPETMPVEVTFFVAPAYDLTDRYAAGFDSNRFESRDQAEEAIDSLRSLGGDFDIDWVIVAA